MTTISNIQKKGAIISFLYNDLAVTADYSMLLSDFPVYLAQDSFKQLSRDDVTAILQVVGYPVNVPMTAVKPSICECPAKIN